MDTAQHQNRLAKSLSPYLQQHANNPVDWYPWGEEALQRARAEDKPIFLSIGYSACHWCHVMEHESFEDEAVAKLLNEHFINIKVDREERPDIDEIYMQATMAMNQGNGGWPMSVFLTSDCVPFFAGTYFPRDKFLELCNMLTDAYTNRREDITRVSQQVQEMLDAWAAGPDAGALIPLAMRDRTAQTLLKYFDKETGGLPSGRNKFPPSMSMDLMLRSHQASAQPEIVTAVKLTLDHMQRGGIYDHLGGGICRYSTDPEWLVPHFEKMLYDQALVSSIYVDAVQLFQEPSYEKTARGIFDYVLEDLQSPEGGFYSTRDADSEGMEGKFYLWTVEQVQAVLGESDAALFCQAYDVTPSGNWNELHGHAPPGPKNILNIRATHAQLAAALSMPIQQLEEKLSQMRDKLKQARSKRVPPGLDDKILTDWNGLMIASLAKGGRILNEPRYIKAAQRAAQFVLDKLQDPNGRLLRSYRAGHAGMRGNLGDYAFFIEGLLNLYESTFDWNYITEAMRLVKISDEFFYDESKGGYFFTADDAEKLISRSKNPRDGAIPSANSIHAMNLLRLSVILGTSEHKERAESIFRAFAPLVEKSPFSFERLMCAVDFYHMPKKEIVIVADSRSAAEPLLRTCVEGYLPNKVVVLMTPDHGIPQDLPLTAQKRAIDGKPTVYVCENYTCKRPVHTAAELKNLLWPSSNAGDSSQ